MTDFIVTATETFGVRNDEELRRWALGRKNRTALWKGVRPESVPASTTVDDEATLAFARVDYGRWIADCPNPNCNSANLLFKGQTHYLCGDCFNADVPNRAWRGLVWPPDQDVGRIEEALLERPEQAFMAWNPDVSIDALISDNAFHRNLVNAGEKGLFHHSWTIPKTWVVGAPLPAAELNTYVRDNSNEISLHDHGGAAGDGAAVLAGGLSVIASGHGADFGINKTTSAAIAIKNTGPTNAYSLLSLISAAQEWQMFTGRDYVGNTLILKDQTAGVEVARIRKTGIVEINPGSHFNYPERIIQKSADESVTNSATLQNDDHLFFPIAASEEWYAEFFLAITGSATTRAQFAITVPSGALLFFVLHSSMSGSTPGSSTKAFTYTSGDALPLIWGITTANMSVHLSCWVLNGANAGNVQLQWAELTAGDTLTVWGRSNLHAWRVA